MPRYPTFVITVVNFLALDTTKLVRPHQELVREGIVKEWVPGDADFIFVSHEYANAVVFSSSRFLI